MKINLLNPVGTVLFDGVRQGLKWHQYPAHGTVLFAIHAHSQTFEEWRDSYCPHGMMNEAGLRAAYIAGHNAANSKE